MSANPTFGNPSHPNWFCHKHQSELTSDFRCSSGHVIPVRNTIPRFVPGDKYTAHFGEQWKRYRLTQLDSYTGIPISEMRLRRCFGPSWEQISGKTVLECGCGAGRFTEVLLKAGAAVTSIDLSEAVEANAESFPVSPQHRIAQADIMSLPFSAMQFDYVMCLGVVQHTPNPEKTIAALFEHVRPGGWLIIDHYPRDWRWYTKTAPVVRAVLKRMPTDRSMRATEALVNTFLPLHKAVANNPVVRPLVARLSPLLTHYRTYPELTDDLQYQWALLDTHDSLTDWYKHRRNKDEIRASVESLGAINVWCEYGGNGVEARAQRNPRA